MKLHEVGDRLVATNEDIQQSLTQGNTMSERAFTDIQHSYDALRTEVRKTRSLFNKELGIVI